MLFLHKILLWFLFKMPLCVLVLLPINASFLDCLLKV